MKFSYSDPQGYTGIISWEPPEQVCKQLELEKESDELSRIPIDIEKLQDLVGKGIVLSLQYIAISLSIVCSVQDNRSIAILIVHKHLEAMKKELEKEFL